MLIVKVAPVAIIVSIAPIVLVARIARIVPDCLAVRVGSIMRLRMRVNLGVMDSGHTVRVSADVPECRIPLIRGIIRDAVKNAVDMSEMMGRIVKGVAYTDSFTLHDYMIYDGDLVVVIHPDDKYLYCSDDDRCILFENLDAWAI